MRRESGRKRQAEAFECTKMRYVSRDQAHKARQHTGHYSCGVYRCGYCGGWHIGRNARHRTRPVPSRIQRFALGEVQ